MENYNFGLHHVNIRGWLKILIQILKSKNLKPFFEL